MITLFIGIILTCLLTGLYAGSMHYGDADSSHMFAMGAVVGVILTVLHIVDMAVAEQDCNEKVSAAKSEKSE